MKKILSIVMALALVLSLAVTAFASENLEGELLFEAKGPKTATGWWYDAWLDSDQKADLTALMLGDANYIVVVFEGDLNSGAEGAGYQIGIQTNTDWTLHLFHSNWDNGEGQVGKATKIDVIDGKSYVYLEIATLLDNLTASATNFSLADNPTSYSFIIGAPDDYPVVAMYAVKADIAAEAPADDATAEADTPAVTVVDEVIFSVTTNTSDNDAINGKAIAEYTLVGDWYSDKVATSWKDGTVWSGLIDALNTEGATLKITADGNITRLGFQSDLANNEVAITTVDGVATIAAVDLLAGCADALAEGYGWCNFIISGDAGTTITAIEVVAQVELADDVVPTPDVDTDADADADTDASEPADTGLALAVVPMIVAALAVVISKRR